MNFVTPCNICAISCLYLVAYLVSKGQCLQFYNRLIVPTSDDQSKPLHLTFMLLSTLPDIDARGFDAGMAQEVGQLCYVLLLPIVGHGKQVAEVVGKHLVGVHTRSLAQFVHLPPDVGSVHGVSSFGDEHRAADDARFSAPGQ